MVKNNKEKSLYSSKLKRKDRKSKRSNSSHNGKLRAALIESSPIVFNIVINEICKDLDFDCVNAIKEVTSFHDNLIKNHSVVEGTARYNYIRLYAIQLLEGQNPEPLTRVAVGRKDRWPSAFNQLRPLYYRVRDEGCAKADRVCRSILYLNRLCDGNGVPDFTEIEKSFELSDEFIKRFDNYVNKHIERYDGELITSPPLRVLRSGPNSKPKWQTADVEAYALMNSEIHVHFKELCIATGNKDLYEYVKVRAESLDRVTRARLRHIVTIRDKGNKCRLVAISDYWTQVILKPIMDDIQYLNNTKFCNVNYAHNHAEGFNKLKKYIRPGVESYDASNWTDVFPNVLQHRFMRARYGRRIADAWYNLVVDCSWSVKGRKSPIKYNRGQGMGTNGSFDIATSTDHVLLHMIYEEDYGIEIKDDSIYGKVGDDLWCYDPDLHVHRTYTEMCGISINKSKTKSATNNNLCGEFVSRNLNSGKDVSRISANICQAVKRNILDLPQLASHLQERDYESIIPLKEIFDGLKITESHRTKLVRTFYLLCKLYPNEGLGLLEKSLKRSVPDLVYSDEIISVAMTFGTGALRDMYIMYSIDILLNSIRQKGSDIFDSASEFDSSHELLNRNEPFDFWTHLEENIPLLTSKKIMASAFGARNELYASGTFRTTDNVLSALERTDQAMTFKELGVISTDKLPWRPRSTKLYNFVKTLVVLDPTSHELLSIDELKLSEDAPWIRSTIELPIYDPIFSGVNHSVIGHCETIPAN